MGGGGYKQSEIKEEIQARDNVRERKRGEGGYKQSEIEEEIQARDNLRERERGRGGGNRGRETNTQRKMSQRE